MGGINHQNQDSLFCRGYEIQINDVILNLSRFLLILISTQCRMEAKLQFSAQMCQIRFQHDIVVCGAGSIRIESYIYIYTYIYLLLVVWNISYSSIYWE